MSDTNQEQPNDLIATLQARAERAERQAAELDARLGDLNDQLEAARQSAHRAAQARELDGALAAAGAIDLDTARLLAERVRLDDENASVAEVVARVAREKPFLFRKATSAAHSAMSPRIEHDHTPLLMAAERAAHGDRAALLDYLRARRTA